MNTVNIRKSILLLILFFISSRITAAVSTDTTAKKANKWVNSRVWAKDLKLKLHKSVNSVEFRRQYESNKELWDKAFAYLKNTDLAALAPGIYKIDGDNVFAIVTNTPPKEPQNAKWELHRKYIDLHYVISGKVKFEVCPIASAQLTDPYDATKDVAHYTATGKDYISTPDMFYLIFPGEVHLVDLKVKGYDTLKKLVIKIRYRPH